jgi:hypothetical protein
MASCSLIERYPEDGGRRFSIMSHKTVTLVNLVFKHSALYLRVTLLYDAATPESPRYTKS